MSRHFILLAALLCTSLAALAAPKPNIVYFYADDLGWGTLKVNNANSPLVTPTIDSLVDTGINFTRGYGCMVCSPARSSQQTGFHQGHTWTDRNDPEKTKAIRAEDIALGTIMKDAGYRTGYYGKWGYGADYDDDPVTGEPLINNPQTLPINHGYDDLLAELHHKRAHTYFQPSLWYTNTDDIVPGTTLVPNTIVSGNPLHPNYPAYQDDVTYPSIAYADDSYAIAALDFVRTHAQTGQPFFMTLAFQTPHTPLGNITSMPKWFDAYNDVAGSDTWASDAQKYAAMVTRMDAHMKNILDVLEDPNGDGDTSDSVRDNTLIIFASDNGGQGGQPYTEFGTNGILSGNKGSVKEGGIRVPTVMNWRGTIAPGQSSDRPTDVTDIMPTLAELAGVTPPVGTDGVSIAPTLMGEGVQREREFLVHESGSAWSIIKGNMKLRNTGALYDLSTDPDESSNIAGSHADVVAELQAYATGEFVGLADTFANSFRTWEGADGSAFEADASWSNPAYPPGHALANDYSANTPNSQWNAVMRNSSGVDSTTTLAEDTQLLALEVGGNVTELKTQTLTVPFEKTLTGRNEIRISSHGVIELDGGTLDTLRWVDVLEGGKLTKGGSVTGHIYNSGDITISATTDGTPGDPGDPGSPGGTEAQEILANGGFEQGAGSGSRDYPDVDHWGTEDGFPTTKTLAKNSSAKTGTYRAQIHGETSEPNGSAIQETGHTIALADQYRLSFWHQSFSNWETDDKIRVELFYLNDSGERVNLYSATVTPTNGVWNQSSFVPAAVTDSNAVGRTLWILFTPDQASESGTEWAGLDDISLTVDVETPPTDPTPATPASDFRSLTVGKDFCQFPIGSLNLELKSTGTAGVDYGNLEVAGTAYLSGSLDLTHAAGFTPQTGDSFTIVNANALSGRFQHADDLITVDGHHYKIIYAAQSVSIQKILTTGRGTPHTWLDNYGLGTDDSADDDNDGVLTWQEFIAGTNPGDASSVFKLGITGGSENINLQWRGVDDHLYYIESSTDLSLFSPVDGPFEADPSLNSYTLPDSEGVRKFYRVRVERK